MSTTTTPEQSNPANPEKKVVYAAKAHTTDGRDGGASRTSDGRLDVKLSLPGAAGTGTNPEQLFAVGWSACFTSAIKIIASKKKVRLPPDLAVDAEVDLCTGTDGYSIQARLNVSLPGVDHAIAQEITEGPTKSAPIPRPPAATSASSSTCSRPCFKTLQL
jgi:Ohr subfamily peroxiredoxin